ncbi:MAG TPA: hypothetical protein VNY84_06795, partial [Acidimicrobiales bacterium]|nr:hypothetical protein [Acidimicrobiales bacterium]
MTEEDVGQHVGAFRRWAARALSDRDGRVRARHHGPRNAVHGIRGQGGRFERCQTRRIARGQGRFEIGQQASNG